MRGQTLIAENTASERAFPCLLIQQIFVKSLCCLEHLRETRRVLSLACVWMHAQVGRRRRGGEKERQREGKREGGRKTERGRESQSQTDRQREGETNRNRETDRDKERWRGLQTETDRKRQRQYFV